MYATVKNFLAQPASDHLVVVVISAAISAIAILMIAFGGP